MEIEREMACDELVVRASLISAADYASGYVTALKLARRETAPRMSLGMAEPFEVGKRRLEMILRTDIPRLSARWAVAMAVVAAVGLPTFAGVAKETVVKPPTATAQRVKPQDHSGSRLADTNKAAVAGLAALKGPGVVITLVDSPKRNPHETKFYVIQQYTVQDAQIQRIVNALFAAGAAAVSVDDQRIGAMTSTTTVGPVIMVNDTRVHSPYKILAIGDPVALRDAIMHQGGPADDLKLLDMITLKESKSLEVPEFEDTPSDPAFARVDADGPGVVVSLVDSPKLNRRETNPDVIRQFVVHAGDILDVVNQLKAAGAGVISVNDQRWVATSYISGVGMTIIMDGRKLRPPYLIKAIGTTGMSSYILRPGGPVDSLRLLEMISVKESDTVTVGAYTSGRPPWAKETIGPGEARIHPIPASLAVDDGRPAWEKIEDGAMHDIPCRPG